MESATLYLALSLLSRFIQGAGSGIAQTAFTSLITKKYASSKGKLTSLYLMGYLSGLKLGPFAGAYAIEILSIPGMLAVTIALAIAKTLLFCFYSDLESQSKFQYYDNKIFSIEGVVFRIGPFFAFLNCFFINLGFQNIEPVLASCWNALYGMSPSSIATLFLCSSGLLPLLACIFSCFGENLDRRLLIIVGNLMSAVSQFMLAPSVAFGMTLSPLYFYTGLLLGTVGVSLSFCFSFHEAWRSSTTLHSNNSPYIYDIISAIMTAVIGMELTMGPLYISILQSAFGFAGAMDALGFLKIGFILLYSAHLLSEAYSVK